MPFDFTTAWLIFPLIGIIAGLLAGLLGIGGGIILVPGLFFYLQAQNLAPGAEMPFALGTSLACIVPTSISATLAHHRMQNIRWDVFKRLAPGLLLGGVLGGLLADKLDSLLLEKIFGVLTLLIALRIFIGFTAKHIIKKTPTEHFVYGGVMGTIASLTGVGGGALVNPYMLWSGFDVHKAVGTAAASVVAISSFGSLTYIFTGLDASINEAHIGYVIWPAVISVAIFSIICAPIGAKLAVKLPKDRLKQILGLLLLLVGLKFLL